MSSADGCGVGARCGGLAENHVIAERWARRPFRRAACPPSPLLDGLSANRRKAAAHEIKARPSTCAWRQCGAPGMLRVVS